MQVTTVGFDIAKNLLQIHRVDAKGRASTAEKTQKKPVDGLLRKSANVHHWDGMHERCPLVGEVIRSFGHTIRLIAPQFVKPCLKHGRRTIQMKRRRFARQSADRICGSFLRRRSNDRICNRVHRVRSRLIGCRTQLCNQIRGLLSEYGIDARAHRGLDGSAGSSIEPQIAQSPTRAAHQKSG
jgi:transposase